MPFQQIDKTVLIELPGFEQFAILVKWAEKYRSTRLLVNINNQRFGQDLLH